MAAYFQTWSKETHTNQKKRLIHKEKRPRKNTHETIIAEKTPLPPYTLDKRDPYTKQKTRTQNKRDPYTEQKRPIYKSGKTNEEHTHTI